MTEEKLDLPLHVETLKLWNYAKVIRRGFTDFATKTLRPLKPHEMQIRINHMLKTTRWSELNMQRITELQGFVIRKAQEENKYEKVAVTNSR